jgi:hypothetical protein
VPSAPERPDHRARPSLAGFVGEDLRACDRLAGGVRDDPVDVEAPRDRERELDLFVR